MTNLTLKDIYLGEPDGKKEARYRPDFDSFFFNYDSIYEKAMMQKTELIIGQKGSGKSLLAELIRKKENELENHFSDIISYKKFKFQELIHFRSDDIIPNEYVAIWEWCILLELSQLILKKSALKSKQEWIDLKNFIEANYFELDLDMNKVLTLTKDRGISGEFLLGKVASIGGKNAETIKMERGSYLLYLSALKKHVFSLLTLSWGKFTLIIDELDDHFRNEDIYKHALIGLVKVVDEFNMQFWSDGIDGKILILLRSDILKVLSDSDLNKIKRGNALYLKWGTHNDWTSPLFDLLFEKCKASVPDLKKYSRTQMIHKMFYSPQGQFSPKWLLSKTLLRPRDLINYMTIVQESNPNDIAFSRSAFERLEREFSECLLQEIKDELVGHIDDGEREDFFKLIRKIRRKSFTYSDLLFANKKHEIKFSAERLMEVSSIMFEANIIGNFDSYTRHYDWYYRDEFSSFDPDKKIVLHLGLYKSFGI